jgi:hypothetical protein
MAAVTSETPLASGSRIHGVPCRTLCDCVSREKSPLKKVECLTRKPGLTLRKEEDLSYGRLIRFRRDCGDDFSKLLRQTMKAMKLNLRLPLIYNVDETGLKLTYSSGNQKLLNAKGNEIFTVLLTQGKKKP